MATKIFKVFYFIFSMSVLLSGSMAIALEPFEASADIKYLAPLTTYPKTIPLTIIHFKNSKWKLSEVEARIRRTETIFSQCEWSFSPITIISSDSALGPVINVDSYEYNGDYSFFKLPGFVDEDPLLAKPAVFLLDAEIYDRYQGGVSFRRGLIPVNSPDEQIVNFSLVFGSFAFEKSRSFEGLDKEGNYEVMAHELAHLIFDSSHIPEPNNILSSIATTNHRTNRISPEQCKNPSSQFKSLRATP